VPRAGKQAHRVGRLLAWPRRQLGRHLVLERRTRLERSRRHSHLSRATWAIHLGARRSPVDRGWIRRPARQRRLVAVTAGGPGRMRGDAL